MTASKLDESTSFLSKRRLGIAGLAAVIGCVACCALPFFAAAGIGGGAAAAVGHLLRPGSELVIGGIVFAATLGIMALRSRLKRPTGSGPSCRIDVSR